VRDSSDVQIERSRSGVLGLQISNAIGRLHKELTGRGPDRVRTYVDDDLIVCILEGNYTRAERTLQRVLGDEPVVELRLQLQSAMRSAIVATVQTIVGREVRSFMSANDPAQNVQAEVLLLSSAAPEEIPESADDARASAHDALAMRGKHAIEAARALREDRTALIAERDQSYRQMRRRAKRFGIRIDDPGRQAPD
jgi:uncharacterized protein YbcI